MDNNTERTVTNQALKVQTIMNEFIQDQATLYQLIKEQLRAADPADVIQAPPQHHMLTIEIRPLNTHLTLEVAAHIPKRIQWIFLLLMLVCFLTLFIIFPVIWTHVFLTENSKDWILLSLALLAFELEMALAISDLVSKW